MRECPPSNRVRVFDADCNLTYPKVASSDSFSYSPVKTFNFNFIRANITKDRTFLKARNWEESLHRCYRQAKVCEASTLQHTAPSLTTRCLVHPHDGTCHRVSHFLYQYYQHSLLPRQQRPANSATPPSTALSTSAPPLIPTPTPQPPTQTST